jgi:hypothetical protein
MNKTVTIRILQEGHTQDSTPLKTGDVVDVSEDTAAFLVSIGRAEVVEPEKDAPGA